jgi:L-ascorbate metabolism protein UlaG (beta-lactamase superfamily)
MAIEITWYGHSTWLVKTGSHAILIDPFFNDNPSAPIQADDAKCDFILLTHAHYDHMADVASIAKRCQAPLVSNYDLCQWFTKKGGLAADKSIGMNLGGAMQLPFGRVKMTIAHHSSMLPDGSYGGNPCGFILDMDDKRLYFAGDTALFGDMQLIGDEGLDLAVVPIGDIFTMGPDDALRAVKMLRPKQVAPTHYNTWPPIAQDAAAWAERVQRETGAKVHLPRPGGTFEI